MKSTQRNDLSLAEIARNYGNYHRSAEMYRKRQEGLRNDGLYLGGSEKENFWNFLSRNFFSEKKIFLTTLSPSHVLTVKNFRQSLQSLNPQNLTSKSIDIVCDFLKLEDKKILSFVKSVPNSKDLNDHTVLFLIKFNKKFLCIAEKLMARRVDLLKNIGSFNVQLAREEREAIKFLQNLRFFIENSEKIRSRIC